MRSARIARLAWMSAVCALVAPPGALAADDVSFLPAAPLSAPDLSSNDVEVDDVDGDGHDDIVAGDSGGGGRVRVFWSRGDGTFEAEPVFNAAGGAAIVHVAQIDGAGTPLDLVIAGHNGIQPFLQAPARTFTAQAMIPKDVGGEAVSEVVDVGTADFDGDGDTDIVYTTQYFHSAPGGYHAYAGVLRGNGTGAFSFVAYEGGSTPSKGFVGVGRFDADSVPDWLHMAAGGGGGVRLRLWHHVSNLDFAEGTPAPGGNSESELKVADVDGDTFLDVTDGLDVWFGNGDGTFDPAVPIDDGDSSASTEVADVTGDQKRDVVTFGYDDVRLYVNRGGRSITQGAIIVHEDGYVAGAAGDFDSDPRDDLVLALDDVIQVYLTRNPGEVPPPADDGDPPPSGGGQPPPGPGPGPGSGPAPGPGAGPGPPPVPPLVTPVVAVDAARIATLPPQSRRPCGSRRNFRIRLRRPPEGVTVTEARVLVNGKRVAVRRGARLTAPVDLRGFPKGKAVVTIRITLADGRVLRGRRSYRPCATKKRKGKFGRRRARRG